MALPTYSSLPVVLGIVSLMCAFQRDHDLSRAHMEVSSSWPCSGSSSHSTGLSQDLLQEQMSPRPGWEKLPEQGLILVLALLHMPLLPPGTDYRGNGRNEEWGGSFSLFSSFPLTACNSQTVGDFQGFCVPGPPAPSPFPSEDPLTPYSRQFRQELGSLRLQKKEPGQEN